ncbi:MAG TPA: hypothetical protein VGZ68_06445 [Acidimicrobiales bacterium]|jgi:hypothetical protein|nr:hypothetical protein [Acidimicrobiales bacterium]
MTSPEEISGWLVGRLPEGWFEQDPTVTIDNDEILIIGRLSAPALGDEVDPVAKAAAEEGRITRFREETREERMTIAREGQHHFGRTISWGAQIGHTKQIFTNLSIPVMTRLRQPERTVLDTLVDSGVARSRSDALAWCVRLVATNTDEWLLNLRKAMESVETIRRQGPLS